MAYTFIVMSDDWTNRASRTFRVAKVVFWGIVAFFIAAAPLMYLVSKIYLAPYHWFTKLGEIQDNNALLQQEVDRLTIENMVLSDANDVLNTEAKSDRLTKSEAQTLLEVAENARSVSAKRVEELETELIDIKRQMAFYQDLVSSKAEEDELQCFNIKVIQSKGKINYGVNFLKRNQKDKKKMNIRAEITVAAGDNMLELNKNKALAHATKNFSMQKTTRVRGEIPLQISKEGLHFLDIKAYDKSDKIIAHCWKTF